MKKPEDVFQDLLGLGEEWVVVSADYDENVKSFVIRVKETAKLWLTEKCADDRSDGITCYDHTEELSWRHLNVFNRECIIVCCLPRGKCPVCKKVYRVTPPWEGNDKHFTKEFEAFALTLMREMPVKRAAQIMGETDTRMWRMLHKYVAEAYRQLGMEDVTCVGVDEMSRRKGHQYLTVFCDMHERRVLYATPGKDAATWDAFAAALIEHNGHPHAIKQVSMDMSAAYARGVKNNCRNAEITFDKFHLIANANEAVDKVRRNEYRKGEAATKHQLEKSRWLWLKNPANLTDTESTRMERIDTDSLVTAKAYQMRLALQNIYHSRTAKRAATRFAAWCKWVRRQAGKARWDLLKPMVKIAAMVESHSAGILAHWNGKVTNAFMEGLNSVFSAVKRRARGYRSEKNIITMLYFVAGKLPRLNYSFH